MTAACDTIVRMIRVSRDPSGYMYARTKKEDTCWNCSLLSHTSILARHLSHGRAGSVGGERRARLHDVDLGSSASRSRQNSSDRAIPTGHALRAFAARPRPRSRVSGRSTDAGREYARVQVFAGGPCGSVGSAVSQGNPARVRSVEARARWCADCNCRRRTMVGGRRVLTRLSRVEGPVCYLRYPRRYLRYVRAVGAKGTPTLPCSPRVRRRLYRERLVTCV